MADVEERERREEEEESGKIGDEESEKLRKQGWFLGELTDDAATSILKTSSHSNTFVVYNNPDKIGFTLSARFHVADIDNDIIEHLKISSTGDGKFKLSGQAQAYDNVVEVVNTYITSSEPHLVPALGRSFETQLSIPDEPPAYDQANRALQPDIAPLPDIGGVKVEAITEAKEGTISPSSSMGRSHRVHTHRELTPPHMRHSHWYRYREHHCCHPKNICHACCYRDTRWNGHWEEPRRKWYDPRNTGLLRGFCLILFWLLCGICLGCAKCCVFCCTLLLYVCLYDDDD